MSGKILMLLAQEISAIMDKEFQDLFEANYNNLCRSAYRVLRDRDSAREIVQEVFVEFWKRGNWQNISSPKAYLYTAVYNRSITALRNSKRFLSEDVSDDHPQVNHSEIELRELEVAIAQGIEQLPDQCKKIFLLSREEEMTYSQIADYLGLSIKTVERQMGIALQKLRSHVDVYNSG